VFYLGDLTDHQECYYQIRVVDIKIQRVITEYRAEILEDQNGNQTVADFPDKVKRQFQYGDSVKAQAIYLSQFQFIPYDLESLRRFGFHSDLQEFQHDTP
jgi:exosome complex RNA-binding protein Csl4